MKKFKYKGELFLLQAYDRNNYASVCIPEGGCFSLDFKKNTHECFFKHTSEKKRLQNEKINKEMNVADLKTIIDNIFE